MRVLGLIVVGFILLVIVGNLVRDDEPSQADRQAQLRAICSDPKINYAQIQRELIYKIEGSYMVYVKPAWYALPIDAKKGFAGYVAECKMGGSARFLDFRTGKLLARWGSNGYVNNEN
jgi:hypothetical protein